jgi:rSAM/selenodomain-associated transferase 1
MSRVNDEPIAIAVLAKAPVPGLAKTRLIPALGAHGAAALQERLTERIVSTAILATIGPVTLWVTPDRHETSFSELAHRYPITLAAQPDGDLGARMLAAAVSENGPVIITGTDCPALTPRHLRDAASTLRAGYDVALVPAEDGGYVLIGLRQAQPHLFDDMIWSTASVMADTRRRIVEAGLAAMEFAPLADLDTPADLDRAERAFPDLWSR